MYFLFYFLYFQIRYSVLYFLYYHSYSYCGIQSSFFRCHLSIILLHHKTFLNKTASNTCKFDTLFYCTPNNFMLSFLHAVISRKAAKESINISATNLTGSDNRADNPMTHKKLNIVWRILSNCTRKFLQ